MLSHVIGPDGKARPARAGIMVRRHAAVTAHDSTSFTETCSGIFVGTGGDVAVVTADGTALTYKNVASGTFLPVEAVRVNSTGTTAADMIAGFE